MISENLYLKLKRIDRTIAVLSSRMDFLNKKENPNPFDKREASALKYAIEVLVNEKNINELLVKKLEKDEECAGT